jgi:hypothetical protein
MRLKQPAYFTVIKGVLIMGIVLLGAYLVLYQNVINERVKLEDEHCIVVNPLIIKRKQTYLDSMKALVNNTGDYLKLNDKYIEVSKKYITEEDEWLKKDSAMLHNPVVRLVVKKDGYQGALMLHRINELDLINTKIILLLFEEKDLKKQETLGKSIAKNTFELNALQKDYDRISGVHNYRWVDYLIRTPQSKCPLENRNIPDVENELQKIMTPETLPPAFKEGTPS